MERQFYSALNICRSCRRDILALRKQLRQAQQGRIRRHLHLRPAATQSRGLFVSAKQQQQAHADDSSADVARAREHCEGLLATHDHPSSLIRRLMPAYARDAFTAIRAFNIEVAMVADQTSSMPIGKLRMQWWKDSLDRLFGGEGAVTPTIMGISPPTNQPVMVLLRDVIKSRRLSKSWFVRVVTAREQYLGNPPFPSLSALETYAESTYSSLHYLTLESLLPTPSVELDHIASHVGKASGIAAVLRGTPILATPPTSTVVLPLDICAKHSVRQEDVLRTGGQAPNLKDAVFETATRANDHLITAQTTYDNYYDGKKKGDTTTLTGFLPAVATGLYLKRLQKVDFDVFHPSLQRREWRLPWYLWRATGGGYIVRV